jgi:chemotaxis protein MotB
MKILLFNKTKFMKLRSTILVLFSSVMLFSCVSSKKYKKSQADYAALQTKHEQLLTDMKTCNDAKDALGRQIYSLESDNNNLKSRITDLNKQIDFMKENSTTVLKQLENLSVVSSSQAESIKKSMDNLGMKDLYIQNLQSEMSRKDSLNMALVMNLKGAIGNMQDEDINIKVDKGVVFIDISDKLLFKSGKYEITPQAKEVLGKVATVLKSQPDIEFMVEGHTDNVAYKNGVLLDNWDLSVKRSTAVVRVLQNEYGIDPAKMAAAGRSEYTPLADNSSAENRAKNRRTRIVILPQLDQFFKLLEPKKSF